MSPNFGYETSGSSRLELRNNIRGSHFQITEDGRAQKITAWTYTYYTTTKWKGAIYQGTTLIGQTAEVDCGNLEGSTGWGNKKGEATIIGSPDLTQNTIYTLVIWGKSPGHAFDIRYDSETDKGAYKTLQYDGFPNPITWGGTTANWKFSIYCTYSVGSLTHLGVATLSGIGTLVGVGRGIFIGKATLSGIGALAARGSFWQYGKATLSGIGTLTSIGRHYIIGKVTLSGVGTLTAYGFTLKVIQVALALYSRSITATLYARTVGVTLYQRTLTVNLYGRSLIARLYSRIVSLKTRVK